MSYDYKPGDPIEVGFGGFWRHEGRTYIGQWEGWVVYGRNGFEPTAVRGEKVRPYSPPIETPDGWQLMRSDELEAGVHEIYHPVEPDRPWWGASISCFRPYPAIVVARRRADA